MDNQEKIEIECFNNPMFKWIPEGKTVLFSGRFDPLHVGHVVNIQRLGKQFKKVIIPILDYPERKYAVSYIIQILNDVLGASKGEYEVFPNKHHFGKITKEELDKYPKFDVYCSANLDVLKHIAGLGYKTLWIDRAYHYTATDSRLGEEVMRLVKSI